MPGLATHSLSTITLHARRKGVVGRFFLDRGREAVPHIGLKFQCFALMIKIVLAQKSG